MPYKDPEKQRTYWRNKMRKYRATNPDRWDEVAWRSQKLPKPTRPRPLLCECCGKAESTYKRLVLDHDHKTGKFRGWLCTSCNLGIGRLVDDLYSVRRALTYLETCEELGRVHPTGESG